MTAARLGALVLLGLIAAIVSAVAASPAQAAPAATSAPAASSYRFHAVPWPGGVVRYYNAAPSQGWALWQAVSAWNRSGAKVRFVATSRRNAQLIIRHDPRVASCKLARATVGFVADARVLIYPRGEGSRSCNKYAAARFLAHELGHVLGLKHEDGGCATMNSTGSYRGSSMCEQPKPWEWRCQLLERDDVRGVVAAYGGKVKPQRRKSPMCPLYDPIAPPAALTASYDPTNGGVTITARQAASPLVPAFLAKMARGAPTGYSFLTGLDACPTQASFTGAPRYPWAGAKTFSRLVDYPEAGNYCYAVWSIDALGRPSARPATAWVQVPPPALP